MSTASIIARQETKARAEKNLRRCLVTGDMRPKDELIRFVVSPDNAVIPDLACELPGRGLWVTAARAAIADAARKNLFARAVKAPLKADPDLADKIAGMLKKRCLGLLGLARGAGIAVLGQPQVEAALKANKIAVLLIADDAKSDLNAGKAAVSRAFTRDQLGAALGHEHLAYVGLKPHGLSAKLVFELTRLDKIADKAHIEDANGESGGI